MRKKISLLLLMLICTLSFVGCASKESVEQNTDSMTQLSLGLVSVFNSMDDATITAYQELEEFELTMLLYENQIPTDGDTFVELMNAWKTATVECGAFTEFTQGFQAEVKGEEVVLTADATFAERDAVVTFIYENGRVGSLTVDPAYSLGEILTKAGLNTLLGMGTVFAILIFIAYIISLFKYIPVIEEKLKKKKEVPVATAPVQVEAPVVVAPKTNADLDLIAVITAAIAASEGTSTDGFVVRSIKRKKSNKWNG